MSYIKREIEQILVGLIDSGKSVLLLGPRQTGKTSLINRLDAELKINLIDARARLRYESDPTLLIDEVRAISETSASVPLVLLDEVQKVPAIMDSVQYIIDNKLAKLVLTGSSARKLKRNQKHDINLLPGRVIPLYMDPLYYPELSDIKISLNDLLVYGSLPEILLTEDTSQREELLNAYVTLYLEEEIRAEAIVRNLAHFSRFLELSAAESGKIVNYSKLSKQIGVAHSTIASYYQILEDCLITHRIEPYIKSNTRKKLTKSQKYLFFDLGLRRMAAKEGVRLPTEQLGRLFEQFVGLELLHYIRLHKRINTELRYWRDADGPEVDWLIQTPEQLIPIEVKFTDKPNTSDTRHLKIFLSEYEQAKTGYIICQTPRKYKLGEDLYAIPWQDYRELLD